MSRLSAATAALALGPGSGHTSLGPNFACNSCLFIEPSPRALAITAALLSCAFPVNVALPLIPFKRDRPRCVDPVSGRRVCEGLRRICCLVAAEEARSRAGRQHAKMAARADDARTGPRPAFCGWNQSRVAAVIGLHLSSSAELRIARAKLSGPAE